MHRVHQSFVSLLIVVFCLMCASIAYSQEGTPSPTSPSTPTQARTAQATLPVSTAAPDAASLAVPFTQGDFTVLTGNVQRPNGITWLDDRLYVACTGDWTVYEIDVQTERTVTYAGGVRNAHALYAEMGENGLPVIWAPDFQLNQFVRIVRGSSTTIAVGLDGPWGIAYLDEESFLVTNLRANTITVVTRNGLVRPVIDGLAAPAGITINGSRIYVANTGSARRAIEWYDLSAAALEEPSANTEGGSIVTGIQNVTGITNGEDGLLYFTYALGTRGVVGRVDAEACIESGGCSADQVEVVAYTELAAPLAGLTISPDGRLYVHTMFSPDIFWLQLPG